MTIPLALYRGVAGIAEPLRRGHLALRARRGKEDRSRLGERHGHASEARPEGPLIWIHAASNGEALSALPLVDGLRKSFPELSVLLTTGTVTSARLIADRAPDVLHQYVPSEAPSSIGRFLDHWRPDLAVWVESELWPSILIGCRRRDIPMVLVNGRISERSSRRWRLVGGSIAHLLGLFDLRLVQTEAVRQRLVDLGADPQQTFVTGDLKASRAIDRPDPAVLATLREQIEGRPLWLAASTHPGEEEEVAEVHRQLAPRFPGLLTLVAPRHPDRGDAIAGSIAASGLSVRRRSRGESPVDAEIYLADTLGEMPLWYALSGISFLGGGWYGEGGHNPLEPAQAGNAILSGPRVANFSDIFAGLEAAGAIRFVEDRAALATAVASLLEDEDRRRTMIEAARSAGAPDPRPLKRVLDRILPLAERAFR